LRIERSYVMSGLGLRVFLMRIPAGGNVDVILRQANDNGLALWVQYDFSHQTLGDNNGSLSKQYALNRIRAESVPQAARGQGISVALDHKARIINMSIGGPNDPLVRMAVQQAVLTGVIVFAAAGNAGPDAPPCYPAAQRGVIAVTATDDKDRLFKGANRGNYI